MEQKLQFIFEIEPEDASSSPQALTLTNHELDKDKVLKVRLDKWLWAARFFKTRALARSAVENGKVDYDGEKTLPSKEISIGATITIHQGKFKKFIVVRLLSTRRRCTDESNALFEVITSNVYEQQDSYMHHALEEKQPRKMVRFLRRALTIPESIK